MKSSLLALLALVGGAHAIPTMLKEDVRVLVMTRQRSGSTALMSLLSQHPKVEAFDGEPLDVNEEHAARRLASLGITEHDLRHNAGGSLRRILSTCRAPACAVKVQSADVHAPATAASLLDGAPYGSIHVVALERNARDEFASWKKAVTTGIWDATPKLQAAHREFGDTACDTANGCWKDPELVNKTSFTDFERRHDAWFREIAALRQHAPLLWLKTEDFFRAPEVSPAATMRRRTRRCAPTAGR
jgi:hypothetical protein